MTSANRGTEPSPKSPLALLLATVGIGLAALGQVLVVIGGDASAANWIVLAASAPMMVVGIVMLIRSRRDR